MVLIDDLIKVYPVSVDSEKPYNVSSTSPEVSSATLEAINSLTKTLLMLPPEMESVPPPPQAVPNARSVHISRLKEEGNALFRNRNYPEAIRMYSLAAGMASTRPLFESQMYAREELAIVVCNRSAAYAGMGEWVNSLVDADFVVKMKKDWPKGNFRKGKALQALGRLDEARDAITLGLQFQPANDDLLLALAEIGKQIATK